MNFLIDRNFNQVLESLILKFMRFVGRKNKRSKQKIFTAIFAFVFVINQIFLPISIRGGVFVRAEETGNTEEEPSVFLVSANLDGDEEENKDNEGDDEWQPGECQETEKWDEKAGECVLKESEESEEISESEESQCQENCECESGCEAEGRVVNENEAQVENEVEVTANTGENEIVGEEGPSEIENQSHGASEENKNCEIGDEEDGQLEECGDENEGGDGKQSEQCQKTESWNEETKKCTSTEEAEDSEELSQSEEEQCQENCDPSWMVADGESNGASPSEIENQFNGINDEEDESKKNNTENNEEDLNNNKEETDQAENSIETGDAVASSIVVNEVNKNYTGENFIELVLNIYGVYEDDINLLGYIKQILEFFSQNNIPFNVNNINEADVENDVSVSANSGNNLITDNTGDGDNGIKTGDAVAGSQVVNIINQNIVGNNWIFVVINIFGQLSGDILMPGEDLVTFPSSEEFSSVKVENNNEANIENNVTTAANSGENEINSENKDKTQSADQEGEESEIAEAKIETGDANAYSSAINIANTNIINNNWFQLMINNSGSWIGGIVGWGLDSIISGNFLTYYFGSDSDSSAGSVTVVNKNSATVENDINVSANTGGNAINQNSGGEGNGDSKITTGDANAWSGLVNMVNTNIVGNNWMFVAVNVLGFWDGNAIFAYPDLEISISDGQTSVPGGSSLDYSITVANKGQADAQNVQVVLSTKEKSNAKEIDKKYFQSLGELKAGESREINIPHGLEISEGKVGALAEVLSDTTEQNFDNNQAIDYTDVFSNGIANNFDTAVDNGGNKNSSYNENEFEDSLKVKRFKHYGATYQAGDIINQVLEVENNGDTALFDVRVKDKLFFQENKMIEYIWEIGDMEPGDEYQIQYQLLVNPTSVLGIYEYVASAKGENYDEKEVRSEKTSTSLQLIGGGQTFTENGEQNDDEPFQLISTAQAKTDGNDPNVLGTSKACGDLPLWIWIGAFVSYLFATNWSLFEIGQEDKLKKAGKFRTLYMPIIFSVAIILFASKFWCSSFSLWLVFLSLLSLLGQLFWRNRKAFMGKKSQTI